MARAERLRAHEWLHLFTAQSSKAVNLLLGNQEEGYCGVGSTNSRFSWPHRCCENLFWDCSCKTISFNPHPFPPPHAPSRPSVSALWASPEWCNKSGDGWGLPQQLYTIKPSHWTTPDPSHMIRSIQHGHNSHLSSGDNGGVKLAELIIVYCNFNCLVTSHHFSSGGCGVKFWSLCEKLNCEIQALNCCTTDIGFQTHVY